jgi:hypothetical protein
MIKSEAVGWLSEVIHEESDSIDIPGLNPIENGPTGFQLTTKFFDMIVHVLLVD